MSNTVKEYSQMIGFLTRDKTSTVPRSMDHEPRNMYNQGQLVSNTVDGSRPGYQGNYTKDKTVLSADAIKKIKQKIKLPVGQKWNFYDPEGIHGKPKPKGHTYGIKKSDNLKLYDVARNVGKEGRAETKLKKATEKYLEIKADPDLLAEKQLYDRELYMGKREQVLEEAQFKYATDKKFREAKLEYEKIQRIKNPAKYKQKLSDWFAKHGNFPPGNNYKESVWRDMFRSSQKKGQKRFLLVNEKGKLLTPDNFPKLGGKVRWDVDGAYKKVRFKDLETGQYVKFDNTIKKEGMGFEKYLDQKSVGGKGAYENAVKGYKNADAYKNLTFKNAKGETIRLGTLMQSKLKTKTDFVKSGINLQHPDLDNAFWKNEVSTASSNMKLRDYEKTLNSNLKAYKNDPIKRAEALAKFKTKIEKLPGGITKVIEDTTYGIKPTAKSVISAAGKEFGATRYKNFSQLQPQIEEIFKKKGMKLRKGEAGFIATDILKDFGKMGLKGGKLLKGLQLQYDALFEGLVYDYHRRYKGHEPELARESLWLPKMIAKAAPELWKKAGFEPFKTGVWEGTEKLLEERLMGENESVKNYIDNNKRMGKISSEWNRLDFGKNLESDRRPDLSYYAKPFDHPRLDTIVNEQRRLTNQYNQLDQLNKPDALTGYHSAYQTAKEKQDTKYGIKEIEAHKERVEKHGGQERFERDQANKRKKAVKDKFPNYDKALIDKILKTSGYVIDQNIAKYKKDLKFLTKEDIPNRYKPAFPPGVKAKPLSTYDTIKGILSDEDKLRYYADNFRMEKATGGRAGYMGGGIMNLKKNKW